MLGHGQEPTFLDWTEKELVGLHGKGLNVPVTHSRGSRRMVIKNGFTLSRMMFTYGIALTGALSISNVH